MARRQPAARKLPSAHDWRTTDEEEIERRRIRAHTERFTIRNLDPRHPIFSNFRVGSPSGLDYSVEVRDLRERQFACSCVDFRINGLGTCKHVEAVLLHLEARYKKPFKTAQENGSERIDIVPDPAAGTLRATGDLRDLPKPLRDAFDADGLLRDGAAEEALERLTARRAPEAADLAGGRAVDPGAVPGIGTQGPAQGLRAPGAGRKLAGAGDHRAALPLPARGHAAPGLQRARVAGRRDGPRQNHPGHRRVRAVAPARPGASACSSSRPPRSRPNGRSRSGGLPPCPTRSSSAGRRRGSVPMGMRRFSPSSITSRWSRTRSTSMPSSGPTSWCWTRRSGSRTGARRRRRRSSACRAVMRSC